MVRMPGSCNMGQNGDGQSGALGGVGTGAELVEKHQCIGSQPLSEFGRCSSYGTRRYLRTARCSAHRRCLRKHRQKRPSSELVKGRNVKSGLSHQGQKTDGFQGDGLTAGVGAGDDEQVGNPCPARSVDGNDLLLGSSSGMTAFLDVDAPFGH